MTIRNLLNRLTLQDQLELLATREIGDYWTEKPAKRHIHVLVESPTSTTASDEVLELRKQLATMQELLNKSVHGTYFFFLPEVNEICQEIWANIVR